MKKYFLFLIAAAALFASCSSTSTSASRLISKAKILDLKESKPIVVTDVMVDLEVSPNKITYLYVPSKIVNNEGLNNVIETAVREALAENDNADVFVDLNKQFKINDNGIVESITITGYPAKYVNFRSINENFLLELGNSFKDINTSVDTTLNVIAPYLNLPVGSSSKPNESKIKLPFSNPLK